MSKLNSALGGASFTGYITLSEAPLQGMITLRGDLSAPGLANAATGVTGAQMPGQRGISMSEAGSGVAWMSPDELLLLVDYDKVQSALADIDVALAGAHALALDVSDARAMFTLEGSNAGEVLAKLCPVDVATLPLGEMRRTRAAQVPVALWQAAPERWHVICFRSVAQYVFDLLKGAATPGREVDYFTA